MMAVLRVFYVVIAILGTALSGCSVSEHQTPPAEISQAASEPKEANTPPPGDEVSEDDFFKTADLELPQADPVLGMVGSRKMQSLNGDWRVIIDPMGNGNPNPLNAGYFKNARNITGMELIEYDFDTADILRVPGDWNSQDERLFFYRGFVWYRKIFKAKPQRGERSHLYFGGANFAAQVFLNAQPIGEHVGGYVPFSFDVTDNIKEGENVLIVRVDNRLGDSTIPTGRTDWWPYGGLTRDVALVTTPKAFIRNAKIDLKDRGAGTISVKLQTVGFRRGANAVIEIAQLGIKETLKFKDGGAMMAVFEAKPELWSPENPKLYDVTITAGKDRLTDKIGFRTIETKDKTILLNGEPVKFRGISTHEEPIGVAGVAYSREHVRGLLLEAKALGANFVRAAHYPYSRHMAEVADEVGILLWEEIPVYWAIDWTNPETLAIARDQMQRLVTRDWNRASVVIWSVANETPSSDARQAFLRRLIDDTRALDDTRLVSAALLGGSRESFEKIVTHLAVRGIEKEGVPTREKMIFRAIKLRTGLGAPKPEDGYTIEIEDPLSEYVDIVSYNEYFGWYYSKIFAEQTKISEATLRGLMLEFMPDLRITSKVNKPIHISEFGAGAKAGNVGGQALIWSEEYQAKVYRAQIEMLKNSPDVQGMTPWILKDFRAMLRPRAGVQDFYNRKGLIDETGQKKLAYGVLKDFYEGEWE